MLKLCVIKIRCNLMIWCFICTERSMSLSPVYSFVRSGKNLSRSLNTVNYLFFSTAEEQFFHRYRTKTDIQAFLLNWSIHRSLPSDYKASWWLLVGGIKRNASVQGYQDLEWRPDLGLHRSSSAGTSGWKMFDCWLDQSGTSNTGSSERHLQS